MISDETQENKITRMVWCKIWTHMANEIDKMPQKEEENLKVIIQSMKEASQSMMMAGSVAIETKEQAMHIRKACQWVEGGIMLMEKMLSSNENTMRAHLDRSKEVTKQMEKVLENYKNPMWLRHTNDGIKAYMS